jgi:sirohydrochlorin ferrochelatase
VRLVDEAVAQVRPPAGVPVFSSFLEIVEGRLIQDGIDALEVQGVTDLIVVPLFVSSGSTHLDEISYALGLQPEPVLETDMTPFRRSATVHMASPIDDHPLIAELVWDKMRELSVRPEREVLLLIGHGSEEKGFHERWRSMLERLAARVRGIGGLAEADIAMLLPDQAADKLRLWRERRPDCDVIAAPFFLSEGYFTSTVVPSRLGEDRRVKYNGRALLPSPLISRWMEEQIASVWARVTGSSDTKMAGERLRGETS